MATPSLAEGHDITEWQEGAINEIGLEGLVGN